MCVLHYNFLFMNYELIYGTLAPFGYYIYLWLMLMFANSNFDDLTHLSDYSIDLNIVFLSLSHSLTRTEIAIIISVCII